MKISADGKVSKVKRRPVELQSHDFQSTTCYGGFVDRIIACPQISQCQADIYFRVRNSLRAE